MCTDVFVSQIAESTLFYTYVHRARRIYYSRFLRGPREDRNGSIITVLFIGTALFPETVF